MRAAAWSLSWSRRLAFQATGGVHYFRQAKPRTIPGPAPRQDAWESPFRGLTVLEPAGPWPNASLQQPASRSTPCLPFLCYPLFSRMSAPRAPARVP